MAKPVLLFVMLSLFVGGMSVFLKSCSVDCHEPPSSSGLIAVVCNQNGK